ncbi:hypothetical protein DV515_00010605, partial [Chloebia gouldiae]
SNAPCRAPPAAPSAGALLPGTGHGERPRGGVRRGGTARGRQGAGSGERSPSGGAARRGQAHAGAEETPEGRSESLV